MKITDQDTIAAISTPQGEGGIGIVRISGPMALFIAREVFRPKFSIEKVETHKARVGKFVKGSTGEIIDEVILLPMRGPRSYTAEDTAEFHCHGGRVPLTLILREVLTLGARMAEPGEFSKRAFLNGRMDLTQAEAVISIIKASGEGGLRAAVKQLEGGLGKIVRGFRQDLIHLLAGVEASLDFPEEEIASLSPPAILTRVREIQARITSLQRTYRQGRILREGVTTAIVGRPNVGKSSLLNTLLNFDRAIVADIPGTTRDIIEEAVNVRGIGLKIMDTAGLRSHGGAVEMEGMRRTRKALQDADLVLAVFDGSEELRKEDLETVKAVQGKNMIPVVNKADLKTRIDACRLRGLLLDTPVIFVSARTRGGIEGLEDALYQKIWDTGIDLTENVLITRMRHEEALRKAAQALQGIFHALDNSLPLEFIAADLRSSLDFLGEITGENFTEDLLDQIFREFCIGK